MKPLAQIADDLSKVGLKRNYKSVVEHAQREVRAKMARAGRVAPTKADTAELREMIAKLLWHVPAKDGGFLGCAENELDRRIKTMCITKADAVAAMYAPGSWPEVEMV